MNRGVVEQYATPQQIYDRPVSMFVADFIGSPPMNFLPLRSGLAKGARALRVNGATVAIPEIHEDRAESELALGVRPEHIRFDDASALASVFARKSRHTQIVTVTPSTAIKARLRRAPRSNGETAGSPSARAAVALRQGERRRFAALSTSEGRMADIVLSNVSKRFGQTLAVDRLDLSVANGEFVVLLGPTGAGKTTTLRLVAGLERPDEGTIRIDGRDVTEADRPRATWPSFSSNIRSIPIFRSSTISLSRSARRRDGCPKPISRSVSSKWRRRSASGAN